MRVYIVEDSPVIQRLLASAIVAAGAAVSGCSGDAQEATADVFALQPDLIVVDISLVAGTGFDVLRALQEHNLVSGAIKVVLTNHPDAECEAYSACFGADRFFYKSLESSKALAFIAAKVAEKPTTSPSASIRPNRRSSNVRLAGREANRLARQCLARPQGHACGRSTHRERRDPDENHPSTRARSRRTAWPSASCRRRPRTRGRRSMPRRR